MILRRGERENVRAIGHDDEARFLAGQECFDDYPRRRFIARRRRSMLMRHRRPLDKHGGDGGVRLAGIHGHDHAFACGEPVGFDDDRGASIVDVGMRFGSVGEALILGSRNAVPGHEGLGKILGALELRRRLGGAKDPQSRVPEVVHHAFGKRRFRTHDRKADALALRERDQIRDRGQGDVAELALARRAGVAGRDEDFRNPARLRDFPRQCMFAPAAADDQNIHRSSSCLGLLLNSHL